MFRQTRAQRYSASALGCPPSSGYLSSRVNRHYDQRLDGIFMLSANWRSIPPTQAKAMTGLLIATRNRKRSSVTDGGLRSDTFSRR
ncbi:hypothetical protein KCP73_11150 [Salmonella enterica subsp. enterica]|nr:hypothetical protein KCP73_11150 [Salmonella enterica subsp. enterica]